jgi:uncharacterized protein YkwD
MCSLPQRINLRKKNNLFAFLFFVLCPVLLFAQSDQEKQLFEFINSERSREELMPLLWNEELYEVALAHSEDMAESENVTHKGSDGEEPFERVRKAKIFASKTGENIARDLNVISAHTLLMQSIDHRENILEPEYTHAAVGIVKKKQYLYVTQLFIRKLADHTVEQARETLLRQYNFYREEKSKGPLVLSESLSKAAQAHVETQQKFDSLTPMLTMSPVSRGSRSSTLVSVYTTTHLLEIPKPVQQDLQVSMNRIGIGYRRIQGAICSGACYLIVLIFS